VYIPLQTSPSFLVREDSISEPNSSAVSEPSAMSNANHMPRASLNRESQTEDSTEPRYGTTFLRSRAGSGVGQWILSLAASRVRTYPSPQDRQDLSAKESGGGAVGFGKNMPESWDGSFRATDREIQKLRKKGVIKFCKGKWEWPTPAPEQENPK
jgi:hypothetical protein